VLVLQFERHFESQRTVDAVAALERELARALWPWSEVDGHEAGPAEVNLFITTGDPHEAFAKTKKLLERRSRELPDFRAAYRRMSEREYLPLWPPGLTVFEVLAPTGA
jgi:hypothetical protein